MKLVAFDVESTGVDAYQDRIVELTLSRFEPCVPKESNDWSRFKVLSTYSSRFHPGRTIPTGATQTHGITDEDVANEPPFQEEAPVVQAMIEGAVLVGYNSRRFDTIIVDAELRRAGCDGIDLRRVQEIDGYQAWIRLEPRDLTGFLKRFRNERLENAHTADADTRAMIRGLDGLIAIYDTPLEKLIEISRPPDEVDRARKLKLREDGVVVINFGNKHYEDPVSEVPNGYYKWMAGEDFPLETMATLRALWRNDWAWPLPEETT